MNNKEKIIDMLFEKIDILEKINSDILREQQSLKKILELKDQQLKKSQEHYEELNNIIGDLNREINLINKQ